MDDGKLKKIVNSSGFPLQIGLEHQINSRTSIHDWKVLYREHSWKNPNTNASGWIDLVLIGRNGTSIMVVECKRVKDSNWIFLLPDERRPNGWRFRAWVSHFQNGKTISFDWTDLNARFLTSRGPSTPENTSIPESAFCIVLGQDKNSRPMLERVAAELIDASEAMAREEYHFFLNEPDRIRFYINIIVTTAELNVCRFHPDHVSIDTGEIEEATFDTVPYLRFRKSLSTKTIDELNLQEITPRNLTVAKENTVFIVNSKHMNDFLRNFNFEYRVDQRLY